MSNTPPDTTPSRKRKAAKNTTNKKGKNYTGNDSNGYEGNAQNRNNFKGLAKDMNGHVYQLFGEIRNQNQFEQATEELTGYAEASFRKPTNILQLINNLSDTKINEPDLSKDTPNVFQITIWKQESDKYDARGSEYKENKTVLYTLVWGQCSDAMKAKIEASKA